MSGAGVRDGWDKLAEHAQLPWTILPDCTLVDAQGGPVTAAPSVVLSILGHVVSAVTKRLAAEPYTVSLTSRPGAAARYGFERTDGRGAGAGFDTHAEACAAAKRSIAKAPAP